MVHKACRREEPEEGRGGKQRAAIMVGGQGRAGGEERRRQRGRRQGRRQGGAKAAGVKAKAKAKARQGKGEHRQWRRQAAIAVLTTMGSRRREEDNTVLYGSGKQQQWRSGFRASKRAIVDVSGGGRGTTLIGSSGQRCER